MRPGPDFYEATDRVDMDDPWHGVDPDGWPEASTGVSGEPYEPPEELLP